jgi:hypothetical protein
MGEKVNSFETDGQGDIILNPVTGWTMAPVAEIAVLLAIEYVPNPDGLETGERRSIQFVLTPPKCLELAEELSRQAKRLLESIPPETPRH